ncbi:hypothetical protein Tco_1325256 [Tanacetum coccineum]
MVVSLRNHNLLNSTFPKLSDLGATVHYNLGSQEEQVVSDNGKGTTPTQESVVSIDVNDPSTMHANVVNSVNSFDATHVDQNQQLDHNVGGFIASVSSIRQDTNGPSDVQTCIPRVENTRPVLYINVVPTEPTIVPGLANIVTKEPVLTANTKVPVSFVKLVTGEPTINERFDNSVYGFSLGKRIAYPIFSSKDGMDTMLDKILGSFVINTQLILKKWTSNENLLKEDVGNVSVWVKLQNVHILAFSEDASSVIDSYTYYVYGIMG